MGVGENQGLDVRPEGRAGIGGDNDPTGMDPALRLDVLRRAERCWKAVEREVLGYTLCRSGETAYPPTVETKIHSATRPEATEPVYSLRDGNPPPFLTSSVLCSRGWGEGWQ